MRESSAFRMALGLPGAAAFLILLVGSGCSSPESNSAAQVLVPSAQKPSRPTGDSFSDAHVHIIDFLQNGAFDNSDRRFPGVGERGEILKGKAVRYLALPYGEQWRRLTILLKDMDAAGVTHAMVSGMPFIKKWSANEPFERPRYYLDSSSRMIRARDTDYLIGAAFLDYRTRFADDSAALAGLKRLHPFVCGFESTDLGAVDLVIKRIKEFPGVWEGIGEVMSRHDDLSNLMTGERPRANHPALKRLARFAGEVHLPVSIHHNMAPISRSSKEIKDPVYLDEFVELLDYCPETTFIWCHAGMSRRLVVNNLPHWVDRVLAKHRDHLLVDLSWVVFEDYIAGDLATWAALIRKYPESFVLGSDVVGSSRNMGKELQRYRPLLEALSPRISDPVRRNLAAANFERTMMRLAALRKAAEKPGGTFRENNPGSGIVLDPAYEYPERAHTGAPKRSFMRENRP